MRLITYRRDATVGPALVKDGHVFPLSPLGYPDTLSFIAAGPKRWEGVNLQLDETGLNLLASLSSVSLEAPLQRPPKILCIGLNYRDHAAESKMEPPKFPTVFTKYPHTLIGNGQENHVFGYTILHDVSARDVQLATSQWTLGKNFPTFGPMGPWIVSKDEIPDPHQLDISLSINGETLQTSNTRELIFKVPRLISYISTMMPLVPGDIISTGTPAGVGMGRSPQRWLRPGDDVVIEIAGIGSLRNPVIAEP
jgi:2-keto-4-pentenoate hydratase/2-oxohepta-3-ene-1,7-dioic acid hydratase in catechol pathway